LKLALFNLENFFLDSQNTPAGFLKPNDKISRISDVFKDLNADIYLLTEIGLCQSLDIFNQDFLNNEYISFCAPGNSDRGIEIGFLVKKNRFLNLNFLSNKDFNLNKNINDLEEYFSRDLVELSFIKNEQAYRLYLTHLKSKWDRENKDFEGRIKRKKEVSAIVQIINARKKEFPDDFHILAGDFNGFAHQTLGEPEFLPLFYELDLIDAFDLLDVPFEKRATYFHFNKDQEVSPQQLDYFFLDKSHHPSINALESGVYLFKDMQNSPLPLPKDSFERYSLPSDHYPVVLSLK